MQKYQLKDMVKGWFVGNFEPSVLKTEDVEVAVKHYQKGDSEDTHHHKIATEITVIVSGRVKMNEVIYEAGDIIIISPNEATNFEALEDSINVVVKYPGANADKYLGEAQ